MIKYTKKILRDDFFKNSSYLFVGMMIGNVFNYLFQITMARLLRVGTFGEMNALFSTMMILAIPFMTIINYLSKNIAHFDSLGHNRWTNDLIVKSYRNSLIPGAVITIGVVVFLSSYLRAYLRIESLTPVTLLFVGIYISLILPLNSGVLQGLQKFKMLSFLSGSFSVFKYVICVAFVIMGLGLNGIMAGLILSALLIGYISFRPVREHLRYGRAPTEKGVSDFVSFSYVLPLLLVNITFAVMTQVDLILIKHFFSPQATGVYSSAAVLGKAVLYLPGAITLALFPMVASNKARETDTSGLFLKAVLLTLVLSGGGAIALYLVRNQIIGLLFGGDFISAAGIVGFFGVAMMPMTLIFIITNYNLARGKKFFAYMMPLFALLQVVGIMYYHDQLIDVLKVVFVSGLFCVAMLSMSLMVEFYRRNMRRYSAKSLNYY